MRGATDHGWPPAIPCFFRNPSFGWAWSERGTAAPVAVRGERPLPGIRKGLIQAFGPSASLRRTIDPAVLNSNHLPLSIALEPRIRPHQAAPLLLSARERNRLGLLTVHDRRAGTKVPNIRLVEPTVSRPLCVLVIGRLPGRLSVMTTVWGCSSKVVGKEFVSNPFAAAGHVCPSPLLFDHPLRCGTLQPCYACRNCRAC